MALKNLDRFKIKTELAKRLCYTMYEAEDERDGKLVLLKVLEEARAKDRHSTLHFLNGARVASLLDNPNICKIYHFGGDLGRYFIASEPVEYQPFRSIIKADFALSFEDLIEMFMRIGRALRYAHLQGAIHGLLNPDSIFINSSGDIKIDDFGFNWYIPQIFQRTDKEALQFVCYTSPELFQEGQYDGRVDIYSLGIILHNLINGAPPFNGGTLSRLQKSHLSNELPPLNLTEKGLPQELENIVQRAISLRDGIRFLNFKDFLDSMELLRRGHLELADAPLEPTAAEQLVLQKHFEDGEYKIDYSSKNRRAFSISPKKLAAT
ncbi:MAG TPA: serine/threonine-protein kinase, partial [bacterium]